MSRRARGSSVSDRQHPPWTCRRATRDGIAPHRRRILIAPAPPPSLRRPRLHNDRERSWVAKGLFMTYIGIVTWNEDAPLVELANVAAILMFVFGGLYGK